VLRAAPYFHIDSAGEREFWILAGLFVISRQAILLNNERALLNRRGEESFIPVLHGALHRSLHRSAARKARQISPIDVPKTVALREGWHDIRAGAAPPFDARCVTVAVRSLPPHRNFVSTSCAVAYTDLRICQTTHLTTCMKMKGEARCLY
jgi:hypothetical protein